MKYRDAYLDKFKDEQTQAFVRHLKSRTSASLPDNAPDIAPVATKPDKDVSGGVESKVAQNETEGGCREWANKDWTQEKEDKLTKGFEIAKKNGLIHGKKDTDILAE